MLNHSRALVSSFVLALLSLVPACGDGGTGGTGNNGEGGDPCTETCCDGDCGGSPADGGNGAGTSSNDGGSTTNMGGNLNVCTPTPDNLTCSNATACECEPMGVTMPAEASCPTQSGNICTPGHNQCGCDLPMGTDYVAPDVTCLNFVNGDTWSVEVGGDVFTDTVSWEPAPNGQLRLGFGSLFAPSATYYSGMTFSGTDLHWNRANDTLERCQGTFSGDCQSISLSCQDGNGTTTISGTLVYAHE